MQQVNTRSLKSYLIDTAAEWDDYISTIPLKDITRVEFGNRYDKALLDLGGKPPIR